MTFRALLALITDLARDNPAALDRQVVVRLGVANGPDDEDLHVGGLQGADVDAGCTDDLALVLDADQDPEEPC